MRNHNQQLPSLDPITFEVLKNSFISAVDQMAVQILKTCHSFALYSRDFSSSLNDPQGETIAQGTQDIAGHVGTLHFKCKAVLEQFGDDINPGDVFLINDPYLGGTHFNDVSVIRPIFFKDELLAFAQSNGHWADVGGSVPGSLDVRAKEHFSEGLRMTPVRVWDRGRCLEDLVRMMVSNMRVPGDSEGDLRAQAEATRVGEQEILRLAHKYGRDAVVEAFGEVQDYVERRTRRQLEGIPDGIWRNEDYIDRDPDLPEKLIPIRIEMRIDGSMVHYDLSGSHPVIGTMYNTGFGGSFSALAAGTKIFFPETPLNAGFYRALSVDVGEPGTVVNASWPAAVAGMGMPFEKIINAVIEMWSEVMPERAMACSHNIEYLQVGGRDARTPDRRFFIWYDWLSGGWGGRNGKDGANCTSAVFGAGLQTQPVEGQERLSPILTTEFSLDPDSGGPGQFRGGVGVRKGAMLTEHAEAAVLSYHCDRARSIVWGSKGGLPSVPHGVWHSRPDEAEQFLGAWFANAPSKPGDSFWRPCAGGGGFGDPLERDPEAVLEDVIDGYVSLERARIDYGVVVREIDAEICEYEVDLDATKSERERIWQERRGWLEEDPERVANRYRDGELGMLDLVRQYGVIVDWGTGELLPNTTETFRSMLQKRAASHWR